jgi:putative DNA primase/helicase
MTVEAALSYAARGWPVHPLRDNKKLPRVSAWQNEATIDDTTIRAWWAQWPHAGVGIATGQGLVVLDVDNKHDHDGTAALAALIADHDGEWPDTFTVDTPSGGKHYYFYGPDTIRNSASKLGDGLDIRGTGGYVCAPPTTIDGRTYRVTRDVTPAPLPAWLLAKLDTPKTVRAGRRNDTLFREGARLRHKGATAQQIADHLRSVPIEGALDDGEIEQIAASASRYDPAPAAGAHDPCSHVANAHRIVAHYGDQLLYVKGIGWHTWSPPWQENELGARRIAQGLGKIIAEEAAAMAPWVAAAPNIEERQKREKSLARLWKWAGASESAPNIESSLSMAQPHLACEASDLDADPLLLGLPSSVLELGTGNNRPHRPADRITKTAGCDFDPNATAARWERFVAEIMDNDADLIAYLQCLMGYALSGERGEHLLPIFWGNGANGKSTLAGAVLAAFGDYGGAAPPGLLIQRGGNDHPTSLASLQGLRFVVASETGEGGKLNEEQVKLLTGGDRIAARRMRMDFYEFKPTHQLFLQSNHRPRVTGTDEGIWRRVRLIPFTVKIDADKRDPQLPKTLMAELPGILAWCWRGWQRYRVEGFKTPAAVQSATTEYRDASDQIGEFIADTCELVAGISTPAADLYRAYDQWAIANGERARPMREFGMRLPAYGPQSARGAGGIRTWRGIQVRSDTSDTSDTVSGLSARENLSRGAHTEKRSLASLASPPIGAYHAASKGH